MIREPTVCIHTTNLGSAAQTALNDAEQHYGKPNGRMNEKKHVMS